jgi:hypothetical protein
MPVTELIEAFFETAFQEKDCPLWQLTRFDGYAYWIFLWYPERHFLKIIVDRSAELKAFPTVEIEGCYSEDAVISRLSGGIEQTLTLYPKASTSSANHVTITRTKDGQFSLCTTVGDKQS